MVLGVMLAVPVLLCAQDSTAPAVVRVHVTSSAGDLAGATVAIAAVTALTDRAGRAELRLPVTLNEAVLVARRIGFLPESLTIRLRPGLDTTLSLTLRERAAVIAPVIVSSTRTERRVEAEPLRVEVLAGEDVGEKTQMHPGDLRALLTEMSGVRVQTTSPSLGGAGVRIQGLRSRYTQILRDSSTSGRTSHC